MYYRVAIYGKLDGPEYFEVGCTSRTYVNDKRRVPRTFKTCYHTRLGKGVTTCINVYRQSLKENNIPETINVNIT